MNTRAERALTDVVAVERMAPGMCKVVTFADAYVVDARGEGCNCPDKQYNLPDDETGETTCKHEQAALLYDTDVPGLEMDDNLGGKRLVADGGQQRNTRLLTTTTITSSSQILQPKPKRKPTQPESLALTTLR